MMKTKVKPVSSYQKTQVRMKQETGRALAQVVFLKNLYREMVENKKKEPGHVSNDVETVSK